MIKIVLRLSYVKILEQMKIENFENCELCLTFIARNIERTDDKNRSYIKLCEDSRIDENRKFRKL